MWWYRSLLLILVGGGLVLLTATLARPSDPADAGPPACAVAPPPPNPVADPRAEGCLDQAVAALAPERAAWLEMGIWQKVQLPGYVYEADGRYRLAPGHRFRLELQTHVGTAQGEMVTVSDGTNLWRANRTGGGPWQGVTRLGLPEVFAVLSGPAGPGLRDEFLQRPYFRGPASLLATLRNRLVWTRREEVRGAGAARVRLVGAWSRESIANLIPPEQPWTVGLPRQCHLYLDAQTLWPERLEWWGPAARDGGEVLVAQVEFRNPVLNRALGDEACARLFAFEPGGAEVKDETGTVTAEFAARAQQAAQAEAH